MTARGWGAARFRSRRCARASVSGIQFGAARRPPAVIMINMRLFIPCPGGSARRDVALLGRRPPRCVCRRQSGACVTCDMGGDSARPCLCPDVVYRGVPRRDGANRARPWRAPQRRRPVSSNWAGRVSLDGRWAARCFYFASLGKQTLPVKLLYLDAPSRETKRLPTLHSPQSSRPHRHPMVSAAA